MSDDLKVVVAGGGRVGLETARILNQRGHTIKVIETNDRICDQISDEYIATVIQGDASRPSILEQASIGDADVVAALTGHGGVNFAICMAASKINSAIKTVTRIESAETEEYERFVDNVIFPEDAGAHLATNAITGSDVHTFTEAVGDLDIMEVKISEDAPVANRTLEEIDFPVGTLIISEEGGNKVATPETTLKPGEKYIIAVNTDVSEEVLQLLRG